MARKNKPTALKVLEGNPGRRKILKDPKPPDDGIPEAPNHLDKYGMEEWERIARGLYYMGVLAEIDQSTLGAYCSAYARWRHAEEELSKLAAKSGDIAALVQKTTSGNWIQQPLIGIANKAAGDMMRYAGEFGLTPSARARLAIDPDRKESKFKGLIGAQGGKD